MKKMLALLVISLTMFVICSCSDEIPSDSIVTTRPMEAINVDASTNPHTHQFTEWSIVECASCTANGLKERYCSCGEKEQETIDATGHNYTQWEVVAEAGCITTGLKERYCSCGEKEQETIEPLGHAKAIAVAQAPSYTATGLTEGKYCERCGAVLVAQEIIPMLDRLQNSFPGGYITTEPTIITTEHLELHIDANVYIPEDLVQTLDIVTNAMETVSGMSFAGNSYYASGKTKVYVVKDTTSEYEFGPAYASSDGAVISSGDLIELFALIHECSHVLQYRQSNWAYCQWAMEGISTYTTYKTQAYIQQNYPSISYYTDFVNQSLMSYNMKCSELYEHSMEYCS